MNRYHQTLEKSPTASANDESNLVDLQSGNLDFSLVFFTAVSSVLASA